MIVEDSPEFLVLLEEFLSKEFDVVSSLKRDEIERLVQTVDLVICDYHFSPTLTFELSQSSRSSTVECP